MLELRARDKACEGTLPAGLLIASAVNQDGRSSSLTAPNGPSQQRTIRTALQTARIDSSEVDGLEMHGTGTSLGDPIEVGAAHAVLVEHGMAVRSAALALSAMKSCMGHTEPSAGLAGLFCALRGTHLNSIGGICHLTKINPHLASLTRSATSSDAAALSLPRQLAGFANHSMQKQHTRGVSSFAFQGTNAHVVTASVAGSDVGVLSRGQTVAWRRERVWHVPLRHPLLQKVYIESPGDVARFDVCVSSPAQMHLCDHRVSGRGLLPAAAFLEVATSAAILTNGHAEVLYKAAFTSPLVIPSTFQHTVFGCAINQLDGNVQIGSTLAKLHQFTSRCTRMIPCQTQQANVETTIFNQLSDAEVSPSLGIISHDHEVCAGDNSAVGMPPAMLDATLQLAASLQHTSAPAVLHIPAGIDAYYLAAQSGQVAMWASAAAGSRNVSDHSMFVEGSNVIHLTGLAVKDVWVAHQERPAARQIDSQMFAATTNYEIVWKATGAGCLITSASYEHHLSTSVVNHCPSRDAATGIQLGQHIVPDLIQTVSLQTVESQGDATKQTVGAETWGVMRCAAPETRGITTFYGCDRDSTTVRAPLSECVQSYGVYGVTLRSGSMRVPKLLPLTATSFDYAGSSPSNDMSMTTLHSAVEGTPNLRTSLQISLKSCMLIESASGGTAFVTGGLGGLGQMVTAWNIHNGTPHATLVGRSGRAASVGQTCITSQANIIMVRGDISSRDEASASVSTSIINVSQIFHAGGILKDGMLLNQTSGSASVVMAPKSAAISRIDAIICCHSVRESVLFSSVASLLGSSGQSNYCAANGWLDAFARCAVTKGQSTTSVQWGAWSGGVGMAANDVSTIERMERLGVGVVSPDQGLTALRSVFCLSGHPVITVNPFIWDRFLRTVAPVPPIFDSFVDSRVTKTTSPAAKRTQQPTAIAEAPLALASDIQAKIAGCVRSILGTDVAIDAPLIDAGLDSLSAVELNDAISSAVGIELPSTIMFDYPSVGAMSDFVVSQMQPRSSGPDTN
ncbi:KR domain-containing protein, partial [bacterium]|nr:KR domain-containing protein [bacterium]